MIFSFTANESLRRTHHQRTIGDRPVLPYSATSIPGSVLSHPLLLLSLTTRFIISPAEAAFAALVSVPRAACHPSCLSVSFSKARAPSLLFITSPQPIEILPIVFHGERRSPFLIAHLSDALRSHNNSRYPAAIKIPMMLLISVSRTLHA